MNPKSPPRSLSNDLANGIHARISNTFSKNQKTRPTSLVIKKKMMIKIKILAKVPPPNKNPNVSKAGSTSREAKKIPKTAPMSEPSVWTSPKKSPKNTNAPTITIRTISMKPIGKDEKDQKD